ncbi:MAG: hypothetical protein AAFZ17_22410 [Cyanobacteria bacterium J06650_10]
MPPLYFLKQCCNKAVVSARHQLLFYYSMLILCLGALEVLLTPCFLNMRTPRTLGIALSVGDIGWLLGNLTMSVWGGAKNRIKVIVF